MNQTAEKKVKAVATRISDDARTLFAYMLLAGKNVSLYPAAHGICLNSIRQFHNRLESFIRQYGDYRTDIEKDRVTCREETVYTGPFEEGTLPFTLFRDGIKWLEFSPGITLEEVRELLDILDHYKILSSEPDGDFVTALWEKHFVHIQYEAAEIVFGDDPAPDDMMAQFDSGFTREGILKRQGPVPEAGDMIDPAQLVLTPQESDELQAMVLAEETADASSHLFMLLDSLLLYDDEESFGIVLDVLAEEFKNFLAGWDFQACLIIVEGVRHIMDSSRLKASWASPAMEKFLMRISDAEHLEPLGEIWLQMQVRQVGILARILQRLHPVAAGPVARLLLIHKPPQLQAIVEDTLVSYANEDAGCLDPLVASADEKMATRLIPIFVKVDADVSMKYLMQLVRHPAVPVRRVAVSAIARGRKFPAAEIFELIDDPDEAVRRLILRQLGLERDRTAEDLLLRYLQNNAFPAAQAGHVLECFKALGKCGSQHAVPYLRRTLFRRKWMSSFVQSPFQRGAAVALAALKIPESDQAIEEARRSLSPGLRRMVSEACGETAAKRRKKR